MEGKECGASGLNDFPEKEKENQSTDEDSVDQELASGVRSISREKK